MKNEIKNKLVKYLVNNNSDVVYITSEERKKELFESVIDDDGDDDVYIMLVEARDTITLSELREMTKFEYYVPICSLKTFVIDDINLILSDIDFDNVIYKYNYIADQLCKIANENHVNIILFDNNIKTQFSHVCDFNCNISDNGDFKCLKNRDGNDYVNGSDYIEYISKNLSNLNYIVFK